MCFAKTKIMQEAAVNSLPNDAARVESLASLTRFRTELRSCLTRRGDTLFELGDAMLCSQGHVRSAVELSLEPEFRRGHGSLFDALASGRVDHDRLRRLLVGVSTPPRAGQPAMFAIDTTPHARPDAQYADERLMIQIRGKGGDRYLPGWPYSVLVGVGWGSASWVDPIEARRIRPGENHTDVTVEQITRLLADLRDAGRLTTHQPPLVMLDAGNPSTQISLALADQPVQVLVRLRSNRVFHTDPEPRVTGRRGAPARHGRRFSCSDPNERHDSDYENSTDTERYGRVTVRAWGGLHQRLTRTGRWADHPAGQRLPIVSGTVIQLVVEHLPDGRKPPRNLWLWHTGPVPAHVDMLWRAYLRRFDQEHFHRFTKVHLGLVRAHLQSAEATDRWVNLVMAAYAQLRLASLLVDDLRRPWQPRYQPGVTPSPYRVRPGFRRLRAIIGSPANPPKNSRPGPGRPRGSKNQPKPKHSPHFKTDRKASTAKSDQKP
jgi:hypothetical protein